ncbi:glycine betaine ABC transporter substrate-binding protein [Epibacterium sp. Ofav1-8]|uniref:glycine betaine ABC transporter substrate-binding protein n=1 Tax=Epibacterium sp. Ofav1-8 TaxID=2917735 RepID=UPI001EF5E9A4|nr:glycine betaine ABC transporter substrate-binding protein [Epibacterium sp. Ofav1-8]MCG7625328.1 glycine betaine ABC transporter substrate-binding protein [Epibacterium sp. Ofav1-8]
MTRALTVGQIDLSFHQAAAAVVCALLTRTGHQVDLRTAAHEDMFAMQAAGEVDLVVSAWLPASHGRYIAPYEDQLLKLSMLYTPYCIWGISDRAPAHIRSVRDLAQEDMARLFNRRIQGIGPGAGISRFSRRMVEAYDLDAHGFHFENGTLADCTAAALAADEGGDLAVVPLWHPQWLHRQLRLRPLSDPLGLLGGQDAATLVLRREAAPRLTPEGRALLETMQLGNDTVSQLDYAICVEGHTPEEAAEVWLSENATQWHDWITPK